MRKSREYTCKLLDLVDEGLIDRNELIQNLIGWFSENDIKQFYKSEYSFFDEELDDE